MTESPLDLELIANRFDRLVKEVMQGQVRRTTFQPWEVSFLLDMDECRLTRSRRDEALHRYQRVVHRQVERGELPPVRFSEFVGRRARKQAPVPPSLPASQDPSALNP